MWVGALYDTYNNTSTTIDKLYVCSSISNRYINVSLVYCVLTYWLSQMMHGGKDSCVNDEAV